MISELISSLRAESPGSTAVFATETLSCLTAIPSTGQVVSSACKKHFNMLTTETTSGEDAEVLLSALSERLRGRERGSGTRGKPDLHFAGGYDATWLRRRAIVPLSSPSDGAVSYPIMSTRGWFRYDYDF
jgi:hypothetical protein